MNDIWSQQKINRQKQKQVKKCHASAIIWENNIHDCIHSLTLLSFIIIITIIIIMINIIIIIIIEMLQGECVEKYQCSINVV